MSEGKRHSIVIIGHDVTDSVSGELFGVDGNAVSSDNKALAVGFGVFGHFLGAVDVIAVNRDVPLVALLERNDNGKQLTRAKSKGFVPREGLTNRFNMEGAEPREQRKKLLNVCI